MRSLFRVYPSIRPSRHPPGPFRLFLRFSLSLSLSCFLSLLRIYRGEQRMWMGWVSPRLGERSITCEPKGEEIRDARRIYRNGAERKPEWWNTAKHARSVSHPLRPSSFRALFSRRLSSFPLFHPRPSPAPPPPTSRVVFSLFLSTAARSRSLRAERAAGYPS